MAVKLAVTGAAAAAAAAGGGDKAALALVESTILSLSKEQLLRDRSLMLPQGWEPDPKAVPAIEELLKQASAS